MRLFAAILLSCGLLAAQDFTVGSKLPNINVTDHGSPVQITRPPPRRRQSFLSPCNARFRMPITNG